MFDNWPFGGPRKPAEKAGVRYYCGLDLGQAQDPSAFCAIAQHDVVEPANPDKPAKYYAIQALQRWPLGTDYTDIAADLVRYFGKPPLMGAVLSVDETGVGRPVCDMLRKYKPKFSRLVPITITSGHAEMSQGDGSYHVAKVRLIGLLLVLLQSERLKYAAELTEMPTLVKELENYRTKITQAANETFNAREGQHDDLLLSVAVSVWYAERGGRKFNMFA